MTLFQPLPQKSTCVSFRFGLPILYETPGWFSFFLRQTKYFVTSQIRSELGATRVAEIACFIPQPLSYRFFTVTRPYWGEGGYLVDGGWPLFML